MLAMQSLKGAIRTSVVSIEQLAACEFCGTPFASLDLSVPRKLRGRYCSETCQRRAARRRVSARLAQPPSKRSLKRLRFTNPLYFS
ncbi:MAG: hypothetical protein JRN67_02045, partial [Nitrososphaerota archaeon]|nr:hypothetical protein [Nitrososphaerota archaeon]